MFLYLISKNPHTQSLSSWPILDTTCSNHAKLVPRGYIENWQVMSVVQLSSIPSIFYILFNTVSVNFELSFSRILELSVCTRSPKKKQNKIKQKKKQHWHKSVNKEGDVRIAARTISLSLSLSLSFFLSQINYSVLHNWLSSGTVRWTIYSW